jgi:hypothetical protein
MEFYNLVYYFIIGGPPVRVSQQLVGVREGAYSVPFHWKNRKFTLQEFKRLQTFPDDYEFAGSLNAAIEQIGNSVPPVFAEKLAMAVLQQIFEADLGIELLDEEEKLSFDSRIYQLAKSTRDKQFINENCLRLNLFKSTHSSGLTPEKPAPSHSFKYNETILLNYLSPKNRTQISNLSNYKTGNIYKIHFQRRLSQHYGKTVYLVTNLSTVGYIADQNLSVFDRNHRRD